VALRSSSLHYEHNLRLRAVALDVDGYHAIDQGRAVFLAGLIAEGAPECAAVVAKLNPGDKQIVTDEQSGKRWEFECYDAAAIPVEPEWAKQLHRKNPPGGSNEISPLQAAAAGAADLADVERSLNAAKSAAGQRAYEPEPERPTFDLINHLERQRFFSERTFGPGDAIARAAGIGHHIFKELHEVAADPMDLEEWIDVVILALDGAWRTGATSAEIAKALEQKQRKNESRKWPDWRTAEPGKAIEHVRDGGE
jgi:hypothetical protein